MGLIAEQIGMLDGCSGFGTRGESIYEFHRKSPHHLHVADELRVNARLGHHRLDHCSRCARDNAMRGANPC